MDEVTVHARRGEDRRLRGRARARRVACVFERRPRDLQELAVLWVHNARLDGRDAPKARIKELRATHQVRCGHKVGVEPHVGRDAFGVQFGRRPQAQRVAPLAEHLPELLDGVSARKDACVTDESEIDAAAWCGGRGRGRERRKQDTRHVTLGCEEGGERAKRGAVEEVHDADFLAAEQVGQPPIERSDELRGQQRVAS